MQEQTTGPSPDHPVADMPVVGEDSAIGGTPTSGAVGDQGADPTDADGASAITEDGRVMQGVVEDAPGAAGADTAGTEATELERVRAELAERTADLQRVSAEYANYRRRMDRDREGTVAGAKAQVAGELLLVLDDVDRATAHGDLTGPMKGIADRLAETLTRVGLVGFGVEGDPFDPSMHEAVAHETSTEVTGPTVSTVMRRGYRFGERVLRPAMVAVTDADPDAPTAPDASGAAPEASPSATNADAV